MDNNALPLPDLSDLKALMAPSLDPLFWRAERIGSPSAWWQHVPFGQWVVWAAQPRMLVELGTHTGVSYTAFCQAVTRAGLDTRCYAVDTWRGDPHVGSYDEEVFEEFLRFHDERYSTFSTLLRATFNEALAQFVSGTVDLLHIDGLHTYEAVRHDFESWEPKLSQRAVVLFHDTNERKNDFGVWRLWAELCEQFPHFEFLHGHGLGVLAFGKNVTSAILTLCHLSEPSAVAAVRGRFVALGERCQSQTREQMLAQAEQAGREAEARANEIAAQAEQAQRQAEAKAEQAEARVRQAEARAAQAEQAQQQAEARAAQAEQAQRQAEEHANAWEIRARESERGREQIAQRISVARRDVYNANLQMEQAETQAEQVQREAEARAERAEARASQAQIERDRALQELDALLHSTMWQATWPLRVAGHRLPRGLRRVLRAGVKLGWWSLTLKLPRKLRERRAALAVQSVQHHSQDVASPLVEMISPMSPAHHRDASGEAAARQTGTPRSACGFSYRPLISVVMPVYNVAAEWLWRAVASVQVQTYANWELCVCDDGSTAADTLEAITTIAATEPRLRLVVSESNGGISNATNMALALARGEFVAFLDNDDEMAPHALETYVEELNRDPSIDVLYSDEDKLNAEGHHEEPFLKPDWSPHLLREVMYVGHLLMARRSLIETVGRLDPTYDGVQDFELMLRLSERARKIHHVRDILYHWRRIPGSVASHIDAKPKLGELQVAAVNAHLIRVCVKAQAQPHPHLAHRAVIVPLPRQENQRISIIMPTRDAPELISCCLDSIYANTTYPDFEVVVVDNGTTDSRALAVQDRYPIIRVSFADRFNFSRANNLGVAAASGEVLVLLNNDTEVVQGDWLEQMLFLLVEPEVGAVGPMLLYPDGTVQHAGIALGIRGTADHVMRGLPADSDGYFGALACTREVSGVTFACVMVRKADYLAVGGLQELYATHYQDVDFCLRLRERGRRILYTPRTRLIHRESATRGTHYDAMDRALLLDAWGKVIAAGDPYARWEPAARGERA